jgi:hypothetical protein
MILNDKIGANDRYIYFGNVLGLGVRNLIETNSSSNSTNTGSKLFNSEANIIYIAV